MLAAVGALGAGSAIGAARAGAEPKYKWKMQSLWQAGTVNQKVFERYCERVKGLTGGRLEITPLPVATVVAYNETLDAVRSGILDGHQSGAAYFAGKEPAFALLADLNGGYEDPYQMQMWFEYGGGKELARELYAKYNAYYVGPVWWGVESVPSKRPIRTVADLKGLKLRSPEGMSHEIWKRLGAAPVNIPGAEVYTALERGVIEATDWGTLGMNEDLGYHKIAKYPFYPGFHSMPMAEVAVNMDRWKALPEDVKAIVEVATRDFARDMIQTVALEDAKAVTKARSQGVELVNWSAADRKKFREVAAGVWKDYGARSDAGRKVYESQLAFLRRLGLLD
jgi:TRAP-type mannitol/chloroaromatic compound transport system substrate-binding protein